MEIEINMFLIIGIFIVLIAGFVQGLTSFGFALVTMPFLVKMIPLQEVVPIVVILSLCTNIIVLLNSWQHVAIRKIWILILSSLLAAPLGTLLLVYLSADLLKGFTGILIIAFAVLLLSGKSFPIRNDKMAFIPIGMTSGLLNGSISLSGPPVALFLSNQGYSKNEFRANITVYGVILNMITIGTFFYSGLMTPKVMMYTSLFVPSVLIGVFIGIIAIKRLDDQLFKKLTLWLIILSGVWTILGSLKLV
ncbi:sulfite exporter TauE/SafE family protein [Paenibacillus sp. BIHB 4019]|nr:sulfite exporter TauE/SafE family protein [Paenibacillus sp. BIHB 4019]